MLTSEEEEQQLQQQQQQQVEAQQEQEQGEGVAAGCDDVARPKENEAAAPTALMWRAMGLDGLEGLDQEFRVKLAAREEARLQARLRACTKKRIRIDGDEVAAPQPTDVLSLMGCLRGNRATRPPASPYTRSTTYWCNSPMSGMWWQLPLPWWYNLPMNGMRWQFPLQSLLSFDRLP